MELVYLWVEKYKNIKEQGFNFSPRFECDFDGKTLAIKDNVNKEGNKQYIENFFGDNINITAIIGKNGSGKSSILTFLEKISNNETLENFLLIVKIGNQQLCWTTMEVSLDKEIRKYSYPILKKEMKEEDYDFSQNVSDSYHDIHFKIEESNSRFQKDLKEKLTPFKNIFTLTTLLSEDSSFYEPKDIANKAIKNSSKDFSFKLTTFMMLPKKIFLYENKLYESQIDLDIEKEKKQYYEIGRDGDLEDPYANDIAQCDFNNIIDKYMFLKILESEHGSSLMQEYDGALDSKKLKEYYDENIIEDEKYDNEIYQKLLTAKVCDINTNKSMCEKLELYKQFFEYDFEDEKGRRFSDLSHGEKTIYAQFVSMYDIVRNTYTRIDPYINNFLFILDEPDLALHPEWQRKYICEFIQTFSKKSYKENRIHLLLTSHSPFILSDLPKQNTIFLDKYDDKSKDKYPNLTFDDFEDGDCINATKELDIKPFGANIHNLLAHGFFMEDGLMGEFALQKIKSIVDFYNEVKDGSKKQEDYDDKTKKEFYFIRDNIGEDYIKGVITNHIEFIEESLEDKSFKKRRIKQLNEKLKELGAKYDTDLLS